MRLANHSCPVVAPDATIPCRLAVSRRPIALLLLLFLVCSAWAQDREGSQELVFQRAQAAAHEGNYALAEKLYRQILASDPQSVPARVNLGLACY